ncbi:MAG: hypothetical protein AAFZ07_12415 [Actinomycetota bacterium]
MYAVSRIAVARPEKMMEAPGFLLEIAEQVGSRFDYEVQVVAEELGVMGRFGLVSQWPTLEARAETQARMMADPMMGQLWPKAGELFQPNGMDVVSMTLDGSPMPPVSTFTSFRSGVARNGHLREAATFAVEIAADSSSVTGLHVVPVAMRTGQASTFGWVAGAESMAELEQGYARFMGDEGLAKAIDDAGEMWVDGATTDSFWRRIG